MSGLNIVTDDRVARYVTAKCECIILPPYTQMGLEKDGKIVGGVVFNNFAARDIEVTVAADRIFTRRFLREFSDYVFRQLDCTRFSITTKHDHVCDIARRLGARMEGVKRNYYGPGKDAWMLGILKENWTIR